MCERREAGEVYSQTQFSGRFRLVMTRIFPAALDMGIAQQTTRGTVRFLLMVVNEGHATQDGRKGVVVE